MSGGSWETAHGKGAGLHCRPAPFYSLLPSCFVLEAVPGAVLSFFWPAGWMETFREMYPGSRLIPSCHFKASSIACSVVILRPISHVD